MRAGGERWLGVGRSLLSDSRAAGTEAARAALEGDDPKLVVVFCSDEHDLPAMLAGVREQTGATPLVGCSTAGEIAISGPQDSGVVVLALGGPGFAARTAVATGLSSRLRESGKELVSALGHDDPDRPHRILLLLTDGLAGDQQEILRGVYDHVGFAVPLVGGCAGDDLRMRQTAQLHGGEVHTDAIVAAGLWSTGPFGIGVHHGWQPVGDPMLVTSSAETTVFTLDDEPALDVYLDRLDAPDDARTDPDAFTRFALTHPLGLRRRAEEPDIRFVGEADFAARTLGCIAAVPQGGLVWFMQGDEESVLEATDAACADALGALGDRPPLGLVAFDCIARRGVLGGEGIRTEIERLAALAAGTPVAGFYTYGEIARTSGAGGFHNQTLVVLAVG